MCLSTSTTPYMDSCSRKLTGEGNTQSTLWLMCEGMKFIQLDTTSLKWIGELFMTQVEDCHFVTSGCLMADVPCLDHRLECCWVCPGNRQTKLPQVKIYHLSCFRGVYSCSNMLGTPSEYLVGLSQRNQTVALCVMFGWDMHDR